MGDYETGDRSDLFDPKNVRYFSILPDEDADEAYCVRHDREMKQLDPVVHHDGGLYTTGEAYSVYTCLDCLAEIDRAAQGIDGTAVGAYQEALTDWFDRWDDGDANSGCFRYLREGTPEDVTEAEKRAAHNGDSTEEDDE